MRTTSITLRYPHEHRDQLHQAGATIEVWPDQAERIQENERRLDELAGLTTVTAFDSGEGSAEVVETIVIDSPAGE